MVGTMESLVMVGSDMVEQTYTGLPVGPMTDRTRQWARPLLEVAPTRRCSDISVGVSP